MLNNFNELYNMYHDNELLMVQKKILLVSFSICYASLYKYSAHQVSDQLVKAVKKIIAAKELIIYWVVTFLAWPERNIYEHLIDIDIVQKFIEYQVSSFIEIRRFYALILIEAFNINNKLNSIDFICLII